MNSTRSYPREIWTSYKEVVETGVDLNTVDDSDPARKSAEHLCTLDYDAVGLWGTVGCYRDAWVQEWDCLGTLVRQLSCGVVSSPSASPNQPDKGVGPASP